MLVVIFLKSRRALGAQGIINIYKSVGCSLPRHLGGCTILDTAGSAARIEVTGLGWGHDFLICPVFGDCMGLYVLNAGL